MDRRKVLGYLSVVGLFGYYGNRFLSSVSPESTTRNLSTTQKIKTQPKSNHQTILVEEPKVLIIENINNTALSTDSSVVDYLYKIKHFDNDFQTDIFLDKEKFFVLKRLSRRLNRAQTIIGYMNFSILDFPMLLRYSKNYPAIGKFTDSEVELLEELVFRSAKDYGFFGDKLIDNLNDKIPKQHLSKMSNSGQYLYKNQAKKLFTRIQNEVGEKVILTSGVRSLMKQLQLFSAKAVKTGGNLSRASRSLAPPGHSYHGIGDFDIGDIGLGKLNFTEKFSDTTIYKKLVDLGFIKIRYDSNNKFGVRYEPWHIKVS